MLQFQIQPDSEIPVSKQLFDQIQFAIASRQYPPGHRLPSTRQLAMITGLHRNTISKVYQQLEEIGLVESLAGSGIYVRAQGHEGGTQVGSPIFEQYPEANKLVKKSLDELLVQGFTLSQARELFLSEIDWRLRCNARVLVTVPAKDIGAGELMVKELEQSLGIPVQLIPLEELGQVLEKTQSGTVVTSRYHIRKAEAIAAPNSVRVIPVDIYDYGKELEIVKRLPKNSCLGIVSLSAGILGVAEIIIHSVCGDGLLVMTAQVSDTYKLNALVRSAQTIISDRASYPLVKKAVSAARDDLIRYPELICSDNYIGEKSINLLKRELGLG
ncbi:MAG: GntR family transcriptional regulator [Xenococcaceae cyanobacterium]